MAKKINMEEKNIAFQDIYEIYCDDVFVADEMPTEDMTAAEMRKEIKRILKLVDKEIAKVNEFKNELQGLLESL